MNFSNSSANKDVAASCRLTKKQDSLAVLPVIAMNLGSCPVIIFMNTLVMFAIKTRRPLQSNYNILLACLAATDMVVGLVSQPLFIAQEISRAHRWRIIATFTKRQSSSICFKC